MTPPAPVRLRCLNLMDHTAHMLGWSTAVFGGAAIMWLGAALSGGANTVTTPATSVTVAGSPRHKLAPSNSTGAPRLPAGAPAAGGPDHRVVPVSLSAPLPVSVPVPAGGDVWDRIAQCESGGRWNINTGNGYSGGLQFKSSTWRAYGGTKYASSAHKATKAQQIEIAEKVRAGQGWGAWPACSKKAGLSGGKKKSSSKGPKETVLAAPKHKAPSKPNLTRKDKRDADKYLAAGKHVDKHGGKHTAKRSDSPRSDSKKERTIVIRHGDTLSSLARKHKVDGGWRQLFEQNRGTLRDPNRIRPGQELSLPRG